MTETLTINGVDLATLVRNVESLAGLLRTPQRRGEAITVPGRHGRLRLADRPFDSSTLVLPMWVRGADQITGYHLFGEPAVTSYYARVDELTALLHAPTLTVDHTLPDGSVRRAVAELAEEPLDFTRDHASILYGRVSVALSIPDGSWFDPTLATTGAFGLVSGGTRALSEFAGSTAPLAGLTVLWGPGSNPEIRHPATGSFLAYDGVIGGGQTLTINCDDTAVTPLVGTGGLVPDYSKIRYQPPRWFEVDPTAGLTISMVHTGGGSMNTIVSGNRRFLTG